MVVARLWQWTVELLSAVVEEEIVSMGVGRVVNMARRTMVRFFLSGKVRENIACRCAVTGAYCLQLKSNQKKKAEG